MSTNEAQIDAAGALAELARLRQYDLPAPLVASVDLLWDLIWEASEPASDWLRWTPCRICGRRWAVARYEGLPLCPLHRTPEAVRDYLQDEMQRFPGIIDHGKHLAALTAQMTATSLNGAPQAVAPPEEPARNLPTTTEPPPAPPTVDSMLSTGSES
jgi:hypothetical protein